MLNSYLFFLLDQSLASLNAGYSLLISFINYLIVCDSSKVGRCLSIDAATKLASKAIK